MKKHIWVPVHRHTNPLNGGALNRPDMSGGGGVSTGGTGTTGPITAGDVSVLDVADYFVGDDVEEILAEIGAATNSSAPHFDVTPALTTALPPWVKPSGSGVITADAQGRITIDSGATYKAFPGMTFLEGTLHLVYRDASAHNSAGGVVKYRTSVNLGRTWSAATTIATPAGTDDNRDPVITALSSGRLLLAYHRTGTGGTVALDIRVRYSDNRGITWSSEYTVPDTFSGQVAGSCPPLELPDGTILLGGYGESGAKYSSVVWSSTDGGLTFGSQVTVAADAAIDFTEVQLRYLSSGNIVALIRSNTSGHVYRSVSTDLGATWSAEADVLTAQGSRPDFVEFFPGALLLFTRTTSDAGRWAVSWDEGATWTALQEVDTGVTDDWEYAAPVVLAPGYVAVPYSIENSGTDADLYIRFYYDGYGTDPLGNVRALIGGALVSTTAPTSGQILTATSTTTAAWGTGAPPTGAAGGDLSGTYPNPSVVDDSHSHTASTLPAASTGSDHEHVDNIVFSGDGATTVWELPAAPVSDTGIAVYVTGSRSIAWVLSGALLTTLTFDAAPASAANNIVIDIEAAVA